MKIKKLNEDFSVCKIHDISQVDFSDAYYFIGHTDEEISLVCRTVCVPENTAAREDGWKAFRVEGVLNFSLVGILSKLSALLAEHGISIFALSTYNTDYLLTKAEDFERAMDILQNNGYECL